MNYEEALRLLALNDLALVARLAAPPGTPMANEVDSKVLALARVAALIGSGGTLHSYGAEVSAALAAGACPDEIVGILTGVASIVGSAAAVAAAPALALALGYDTESALESPG